VPDLATRAEELARTFRSLSRRRLPSAPVALPIQRSTYTFQASVPNWKRVAREASRERARARTGLRDLRPWQEQITTLRTKVEGFVDSTQSEWVPLDHRAEWPDIRQKMLDGAPDELAKHGVKKPSRQELEAVADQVGGLGRRQIVAMLIRPIERIETQLDETTGSWHASLLGSELATAIASFNLRVRTDVKELRSLDSWLEKTNTTLKDYERDIWRALRQGDKPVAAATARSLLQWTRETLATATKTAAMLARARLMTVNRWALGPQALATADVLRALLRGQALAHLTTWFARGSSEASQAWLEASLRPFASRWRAPRTTMLHALWGGAVRSGTTVTIEGVAGRVSNVHTRRKVLSSTWLTDAGGLSIRVGISHIKLDSGGLVEGAYARVTGRYARQDEEFGTPMVTVGRRKFGDDSKHSWEDWVTLQIRRHFTPLPHGLTASWSWERGAIGAANQLRFGSWIPYG
jgi:hypothetical protein